MHPQGDNLYGYGPTTHFLAYFRLVLGATNTPPAPRFRPVLGLAAPAAPFGSFGTFRDLGSPEPQNMHMHVLGLLAVLAKNFLGALRAQSEGQGNLSMHP